MAQKRRLLLYSLPLALFIALIALLYTGIGKDPTLLQSEMVGKALPKFSKNMLLHPKQTITEKDIKGPALLNIWASWCPACFREHPLLLKISNEEHIKMYGLNYKDEREDALAFIKKMGNPYKAIIVDYDGRLGIDLGVYGVPETFVIDKNNRIVYRHVGIINEVIWEKKIKPLLLGTVPPKNKKLSPESEGAGK